MVESIKQNMMEKKKEKKKDKPQLTEEEMEEFLDIQEGTEADAVDKPKIDLLFKGKTESISKESFKKARELMKHDVISPDKCRYCGKKTNWAGEGFCNKEHEDLMQKTWDNWKAKGLCMSCGEDLPEKRFHKDTCDVCIGKINLLMSDANKIMKLVNKNG